MTSPTTHGDATAEDAIPRDDGPILLRPPPELPERDPGAGPLTTALPMLGGVGSMLVVMGSAGVGGQRIWLSVGALLTTTALLVGLQLDRTWRTRRSKITSARTAYLGYLAQLRSDLVEAANRQRGRRSGSNGLGAVTDFVRIGVETRPAEPRPVLPPFGARTDPFCATALDRLLAAYAIVPGVPLSVDLSGTHVIDLSRADDPLGAARALACTAAASRIRPVLVAPRAHWPEWDWLKWLPGACAVADAGELCHFSLAGTGTPFEHILAICHDTAPGMPAERVTYIDLSGAPQDDDRRLRTSGPRFDTASRAAAESAARRRAGAPAAPGERPGSLPELIGVALRPGEPLERPPGRPPMRVPVGIDHAGRPVELDLSEASDGGAGPHGLVIGATGSGKSEFLRTLVLGLAFISDPENLNFVLVDFKGGATFAGLAGLPQVSALITNLADESTLVERMRDALEGELRRRQELLRAAGGFASHREYAAARAAHPERSLEPLPRLLIVVDEFSELLAARPDFIDTFVAIGRLGRSLGIHLLLASQRLEEGRLRGLDSHLSYRVALRTFSESESRAVLGTPDAAHLPATPGVGFLRTGSSEVHRFTTSYVSGPYVVEPATAALPSAGIRLFTLTGPRRERPVPASGPSALEVAVSAVMAAEPHRARRIWLPPLDQPFDLGLLLPDLATDPRLGLVSARWRERGLVPLGLVDRPREQRRDVLSLDLRGSAGHLIVIGGPRAGKSTALASTMLALAVTRTPREARFLVLDCAGALRSLRALPHLSGLADLTDPDLVRRMLAEARRAVDRGTGANDDDHVYLVVDGWDRLVDADPESAAVLHTLGAEGLAAGVHLIVSTTRWGDVRMATRELFGARIELRLGDPLDSEIDRRAAAAVPANRPGRAVTDEGHHALIGLPALGPTRSTIADCVRAVAAAWPHAAVPALRELPTLVALTDLADDRRPRIGVSEADLEVVGLDWRDRPHLVVFGDSGAGKSAFLRLVGAELVRTRAPGRAQLVVLDPRRTLLGELPDDHLLHYAASATEIVTAIGAV
ncbi:MAG: type VII secretion protein EccCb, partial [Nocardioides sp.]